MRIKIKKYKRIKGEKRKKERGLKTDWPDLLS